MKKQWETLLGKYGKKKVSIALAGVCVGIAALAIGLSVVALQPKDSFTLKQETYVFEYGKEIELLPKDLIKTSDQEILEKTEISMSFPTDKLSDGKLTPKVGSYTGKVLYKDENLKFTVKVKDTKAPKFVDLKKEIKIEQNAESVEYAKCFKAEDLSESKITVDSKDVKLDKVGTYKATVTAADKYKNKIAKDVSVTVVSKDKVGEVTAYVDGAKPASKATKEEKAKVEEKAKEQAKTEAAAEQAAQEQANQSQSGGGTAGSTATGGGTTANPGGSTNGGGGSAPNKGPIVQLDPTPLGGQIFENDILAGNWAEKICKNGQSRRDYASQFGYTTITNYIGTQIRYGYANTREVVYVKYSITWTFQ